MVIKRHLLSDRIVVKIDYEKGEKCICCNKVYDKKTSEQKEFSNLKDSKEFIWLLEYLQSNIKE